MTVSVRPTIVFQTDFGAGGGGAMAGVVKSVDAGLGVYDFIHDIEPYNIRQAAYQLSTVTPLWPAGTVFVSVVDPGVGTSRRGCVARLANGSYVVTPDNGTLTLVADDIAEVRRIDERTNRLPGSENVHIFNGRDVFAYTAARLAAGVIAWEEVGPAYPVAEVVRIELTRIAPQVGEGWAEGGIYDFDVPYGSARINIRNADFQQVAGFAYGDLVRVRVTEGAGGDGAAPGGDGAAPGGDGAAPGGRIVYEGEGRYGRTFGEAEDRDACLVGDIQPGERQMLRLNTRGGFLQTHAPELLGDLARAAAWHVRFERVVE